MLGLSPARALLQSYENVFAIMRYRPEIDGLRALAVLPVVLFHAGINGFSGGFVGVDIFFVISGYLITSLITEELQHKKFSIISFYERRVRRIFPALFVVVFFSSVAASYLFPSSQFYEFAKSVLATTIFASNVLFWQQSGYFAGSASEIPLLHTWSLAVEEQFYIFFPLLLIVVYRWLKGRWVVWLAPIAVLSFATSVWGVSKTPSATFYLAPTRTWELLLGSLLAVAALPRLQSQLLRPIFSVAGLSLIAWSVFTFSGETPFPGANALFPCMGAALVIYSEDGGPSAAGRFLGSKPIVFIGLISYSLYLWHWPLLVFAQSWKVLGLTAQDKIAVVGVSFLAAALSWSFVEMPFRRRGTIFKRKLLFTGAAGTMVCAAAFGLFGYLSHGWPSRIPARALEIEAYSKSINPRTHDCLGEIGKLIAVVDACTYGANVAATLAVWGDSHANVMVDAIGGIAKQYNEAVKFYGVSGCPPILGVERIVWPGLCPRYNDQVIRTIAGDSSIRAVILISRYAVYLEGWNVDFGPAEEHEKASALITDEKRSVLDLPSRRKLFATQMSKTVDRLIEAGKTVVLVYPVPETGYNIPLTLAKLIMAGKDPDKFTRPADYYRRRQQFVFGVLDSFGSSEKIIRIFPHQRLCDERDCIVIAEGRPIYFDDDHLSLAGAAFIAPLFEPLFKR